MHNHHHLLKKMKKKGWSKEEIEQAHLIFSEHKPEHHILHPIYDKILHWTVFITIIIGNFLMFSFFTPIVFLFQNWFGYFLISLVAGVMGMVFEIVIRDLTHLERHHHFFVGVVIPLISMFSFVFFLLFLRKVYMFKTANLFLICGLYTLFFILPYYIRRVMHHRNFKKG